MEDEVHEEGLAYLREVFIPDVMLCGIFSEVRLRKVLPIGCEWPGNNYAVQFGVSGMEALEEWLQKDGFVLFKRMFERFGEKAPAFATVLEDMEPGV